MTDNLKPCPFCGLWASVEEEDPIGGYVVRCGNCGSQTPIYLRADLAIDAWNARAERTCTNMKMDGSYFMCSRCHAAFDMLDWEGEPVIWVDDSPQFNAYCPHCGARVVDA